MDGSGADHQIAVPQVFGVVADGHGDAQGPEVADRVALRHVGALDMEAHAPQHLRQGAHGHAADADQVDAFLIFNVGLIDRAIYPKPPDTFRLLDLYSTKSPGIK